jgi:uncharacterized protein YlxW (UPF0749 family)
MVLMDIRIVSTSAARRVRNTVLLHGRVFSPPFEIKPIGNPTRLQAALDPDSGVRAFRGAGNLYGLGPPRTTAGRHSRPRSHWLRNP